MKRVLGIHSPPARHWVGDGFPVRTLFSYAEYGAQLSPFLLLDHAGPLDFSPTTAQRGVGEHPHRGFETVTIVYQGEVAHHDSTGAGGLVGPGDVQWMTAGSGILHEEFHSAAFASTGGTLEMVQLWVNLPARDKMIAPGYQTLLSRDIPVVELADGAGFLRVIAGEYGGAHGPAHTHSPMAVWDLRLRQQRSARFELPAGHTLALVVLRGAVRINGTELAHEGQWALFDRPGSAVDVDATSDAMALLLSGEPIDEPIAGHGPFVMNSQKEIAQAIDDFASGRFGHMPRDA